CAYDQPLFSRRNAPAPATAPAPAPADCSCPLISRSRSVQQHHSCSKSDLPLSCLRVRQKPPTDCHPDLQPRFCLESHNNSLSAFHRELSARRRSRFAVSPLRRPLSSLESPGA